ncbi:hypothetical protein MMC30_007356 [Trapelia coarctata]|nr:hypothetical protein [Trapelia coarctata]
MDQQHGFLHPLQFLNDRLSALASFSYGSPQDAGLAEPASTSPEIGEAGETREEGSDGVQEDSEDKESVREAASVHESRRKTPRRTATSFQLAHPPPTPKHKQRWKARSKVFLQLRQFSGTRNPVPTLEVLPSTLFAHRLMKHCPRSHNRKISPGADDLVIVNSQMYGYAGKENRADEDSDEENGANREVVALISPPGKGDPEAKEHAHIYVEGGATWTASAMEKGGYEFTTYDQHGLQTTVRWVLKSPKRRRGDSNPRRPPSENEDSGKAYRFSILNPLARRHPVIGSMDRYVIDVVDQYTTPSGTPAMTPTFNTMNSQSVPSPQQSHFGGDASQPTSAHDVDEQLRMLVLVTGIWVAFVEGWAKYNTDTGHSTSTINAHSPWTNRPTSGRFELDNGLRSGTPQSTTSSRSRHTSFNILHRSTASASSTPTAQRSPAIPQRAISSGGSAAGRALGRSVSFAKRRKAAVFQDDLDEDQDEIIAEPALDSKRNTALQTSASVLQPQPPEATQPSSEERELTEGEEAEDEEAYQTPRLSGEDRFVSGVSSPAMDSSSVVSNSNPKKKGKVGRLLKYISKRKKRDR